MQLEALVKTDKGSGMSDLPLQPEMKSVRYQLFDTGKTFHSASKSLIHIAAVTARICPTAILITLYIHWTPALHLFCILLSY